MFLWATIVFLLLFIFVRFAIEYCINGKIGDIWHGIRSLGYRVMEADGTTDQWSPPPITETKFGEFSQIGQGSRNLGKNVKCLIWIWQNFEPTLALRICQWAIFLCCKMAKFRASDLVIWPHCPQFWPILKMLNKLFNNLGPEGHLTFEMIRI